MNLIFIRHAQSTANARRIWQGQLDFPLSPLGQEQASKAGESLRGTPVASVYSSPLSRAAETARIIAARLDYPEDEISYPDGLLERHGGELQGHVWDEYETEKPERATEFLNLPDTERWSVVGAESTASALDRAWSVIEDVHVRHDPEDTVVLVSHGGLLATFFRDAFGPEVLDGVRLGNTSITRVALDDSAGPPGYELKLLDLGSTAHLNGS